MSQTTDELDKRLAELRTAWTYFDVLALALAESGLMEFDADPAKWNSVVSDLQVKYPDVFDEVFFDRRDPKSPRSREVDSFLRLMVRSGSLNLAPTFRRYQMPPATSAAIKERQWPRLDKFRSVIDGTAQVIRAGLNPRLASNGHIETTGA